MIIRVEAKAVIKCKSDEDAFKAVTDCYTFVNEWSKKYTGFQMLGTPEAVDDGDTNANFEVVMHVDDMARAYEAGREVAAFLHQWSHRWNVGEHLDVDDCVLINVSKNMKEQKSEEPCAGCGRAIDGPA